MTIPGADVDTGYRLPDLVVGPITRAVLALFAGASHDHTALHIDTDFARSAGHEDVFAHGMLVMAHMGRLITRWRAQRHLIQMEGRFMRIVHVGDRLTYSAHVAAIRAIGGVRHADIAIVAVNQSDGQVMSGSALVRLDDVACP